jgi:hypothetical protein
MSWLLAFVHAVWRSAPVQQARMSPAWREQCWAIVTLALSAVLLNWITTGDHLLRTVGAGYWPVAGADLFMLTGAAIAVLAAGRLRRRGTSTAPAQAAAMEAGHA